MVASWCHSCSFSLRHYSAHTRDWGAYTQEVAIFSTKRWYIVGNITYGSRGGVENSFNIHMRRLEYGGNLVSWLFVEPRTLGIHERDW